MQLNLNTKDVLILGAGDGCAIREVLKYDEVKTITLVDLDPRMTDIGANHKIFRELNQNAFHHPKVKTINADGFTFLEKTMKMYDVIIADFPDPKSVDLSRLYSLEFYRLCYKQLRAGGVLVTQSTSPYFCPKVYRSIEKTMKKAGFSAIPLRNHVYTFGEWSWILGVKNMPQNKLKKVVQGLSFENIPLRWLTKNALPLLTSFGKEIIEFSKEDLEINTLQNPILFQYYQNGTWDVYWSGGL